MERKILRKNMEVKYYLQNVNRLGKRKPMNLIINASEFHLVIGN